MFYGASMSINPLQNLELSQKGTLQEQLRTALTQVILNGNLVPGVRLPGTRTLANDLEVSRNTVTLVYQQLEQEGLIIAKPGSGFWVPERLPELIAKPGQVNPSHTQSYPPLSAYGESLQSFDYNAQHQAAAFAPGVPDLKAFPEKTWSRLYRGNLQRSHLLGYQGFKGLPELRTAITQYLRASRAVVCSPEQILITHGAQSALNLISMVLTNPGDEVMMENPGYQGARRVFQSRGCEIQSVGLRHSKLDLTQLPEHSTAKLLYCTPNHQYPMGGILDSGERMALLNWANQHNIWLIEDDYDGEYHFNSKPFPSMQGMSQGPVIYLGSFSKTMFPSMRLGYLVLPELLVPTFGKAKAFASGETSPVLEATTAEFIEQGHFYRHLRRMRTLYAEKWQALVKEIQKQLGDKVEIVSTNAGMHLTLVFESPLDKKVEANLKEKGVYCGSLSNYFIHQSGPSSPTSENGLVLGFGNMNIKDCGELVKKLKTAFSEIN